MGMVEVESTFSWQWFLTTLKNDLNIVNTSPYTIMSDKQKGLIKAVQIVFPDSEHKFCVRHLYENYRKLFKGETLKNHLWAIARSTNSDKWNENREKLRADSQQAYDWLDGKTPNQWVKAFFSDFPKCDILLNDMSEVYNSYILEARELAIISMLHCIMGKITVRHETKQREAVEKWSGRICPKIRKKIEKNAEFSGNCYPTHSGLGVFSVQSGNKTYIVDIPARCCSCNRFQLSGIPCNHTIACCRAERIDPEELVHKCYTIETYLQAYGGNIMPMRDISEWEDMNGIIVHPPVFKKVMGRPPKNRKKTPEEKKKKDGTVYLNKKGVTMHCSVCGQADHNSKGHDTHVAAHQQANELEEEEFEDPAILQDIMPHRVNPRLDPINCKGSMVYNMSHEERAYVSS
ncbi:hypothetical protein ACQJBY_069068 [Aegilops geniculata]